MMIKRKPDSFTLVELLIVIGIIATLAALSFPAFNVARGLANRTADTANLGKNIGTALNTYAVQNDGWFPVIYDPNGEPIDYFSPLPTRNANEAFRVLFAEQLMDDEKVFFSQGASTIFRKGDNNIGTPSSNFREALDKRENSYSYFAGHNLGSGSSLDPIAWLPTQGGVQRDPKGWRAIGLFQQVYGGQGLLVLRKGGSVEWVKKGPDGNVLIGNTNSFSLNIKAVAPDI